MKYLLIAVGLCALVGGIAFTTLKGKPAIPEQRPEQKVLSPVDSQPGVVVVPDVEFAVRSRAIQKNSHLGLESTSDTLKLERIYGDSVLFARITAIREVGTRIAVTDSRTSPHLFVFDKSSARLIQSHGRQGKGPGEILYPSNIVPDERKQGFVWIYDFNQRRFSGFDILRDQQDAESPTLNVPLAGTLLQPTIRAGRVISNGLFPKYSLIFLDSTGTPIGRSDLIAPFVPPEVTSNTARRLVNVSSMAYSPHDRSRLVLAYQFSAELDIIDLKSGKHITANGPRPVTASFRVDPKTKRFFWNKDSQQAYWDVTADETLIYALFCGEKDNARASGEVFAQRIHVFDWEGRFLAEIATDRPIRTLSINQSGDILYGSVEDPWPAAAGFSLPRALLARLRANASASH